MMTLTDEERRVLEYVHTKPEERGRILEILRSDEPVRVSAYDAKTGGISSLAPPGMSYHQAALEAVAALERGEFH